MNKLEIYAPCSPSKLVSDQLLGMIKIILSYGGGVGGSKEVLYVKASREEREGWLSLTYLNGHSRKVNLSHIVSVEEVEVAEAVYDITAHANYHEHTTDYEESKDYYLLEHGQSYFVSTKYGTNRGNKINISK